MDEQKRADSQQKKTLLKVRLAIKEKSAQLVAYWYPILEVINQEGVPWKLEYLDCVTGPAFEFWQEELKKSPWNKYDLSPEVVQEREDLYFHDKVLSTYPGTLPLRYLPELSNQFNQPQDPIRITLEKCITALKLPEQPVYFFLSRFSPVLVLPLSDLLRLANDAVLPLFEDVCITSNHTDWLIFRSMEDEWRFGRLNLS